MQLKAAEVSCKSISPYWEKTGRTSFAFKLKKKKKRSVFTVNIYFFTTQTTLMKNIAF